MGTLRISIVQTHGRVSCEVGIVLRALSSLELRICKDTDYVSSLPPAPSPHSLNVFLYDQLESLFVLLIPTATCPPTMPPMVSLVQPYQQHAWSTHPVL